jgi:DNA invertase Pin-like site-specific DNA recombinase
MQLVGYLRVSTDRQADEGLGLEVQEQAIREWAQAHGHELVALTRTRASPAPTVSTPEWGWETP